MLVCGWVVSLMIQLPLPLLLPVSLRLGLLDFDLQWETIKDCDRRLRNYISFAQKIYFGVFNVGGRFDCANIIFLEGLRQTQKYERPQMIIANGVARLLTIGFLFCCLQHSMNAEDVNLAEG